ncbi:hypothetical protein [Novosphingobium aquimarinum]|uniref:hypothetical protein n=1 Tax=Novosphingobium aquimarinum TaxID=2682494 RepID=UPI0012EC787A|nr:hypothetical protein [Novosphingobium aquimarinum]
MTYMLQDLAGLALGTIILFVILIVPGTLIADLLDRFCPPADDRTWKGWSPILGLIAMPVLIVLGIRLIGLEPTSFVVAGIAIAAMVCSKGKLWLPNRLMAGFMAGWWLFCAAFYVDVDAGGGLHQSLAILDLVKHAAVVREIAQHGLPMHDPFFLREGTAGYYHYFYDAPAMAYRISGGLVDPRMAFVAGAFWTGGVFPLFLYGLIRELGWQRVSDTRLWLLCGVAAMLGGLDLIGLLFRFSVFGILEPNIEWWDDEISFVPTTAAWVPHHLSAVIAVYLAIVMLGRAELASQGRERLVLIAAAGVAFAAAFGLSIWVTIGAVFVLAASLLPLSRLSARWIAGLAGAGAVALLLSLPQFYDLLGGRAVDQAPLGLGVREPARSYPVLLSALPMPVVALLALALAPLVWGIEFGVFALGAWLFHRSPGFDRESRLARLLLSGAIGALVLNFFVHSTIINNDFGWRVAWFAQMPAMIWTICAVQKLPAGRALRRTLTVAAVLGLMVPLYDLAAARFIRPPFFRTAHPEINPDPEVDLAMRQAYDWANATLPADAVLQHNPAVGMRAYDFGLYSNHRIVVADRQANLFGGSRDDVARRVNRIGEAFAGERPIADVARAGATHLVVTRHDPIWTRMGGNCRRFDGVVCILPLDRTP